MLLTLHLVPNRLLNGLRIRRFQILVVNLGRCSEQMILQPIRDHPARAGKLDVFSI